MNITIEELPKDTDLKFLLFSLRDFNNDTTKTYDNKEVAFFLRDSRKKIRGGIHARICWELLNIKYLWIEETFRGQGYGTKLLQQAESYAKAKGCTGVFLDTYSFQAPKFYKKFGYKIFGVLDGFKGGHKRYYLRKNF